MTEEKKYKQNKEENEKLLTEFKEYLTGKKLSVKTIKQHVNNLYFYLNEYLNEHNVASAKEGMGYGNISDFMGYFFIRKCMWSTPATVRSTAASLKKFYTFMYEKGLVEKEDFEDFKDHMKFSIDDWCEDCAIYNGGGEYIDF